MIIKLTSSKKGTLSFDIRFESLLKNKVSISENVLKANGYAPVHAEPSYRGEKENAVVFDESRRTRFTSLVKIKNTDGTIISTNNTIGIKEGSEALIFISIATSFNGFEKNPATQGINNEA
jgi:alpha-L-fucosidase 2